ncbi:Com family DNA-binding transcriptional regulator [Conchiformibius kuhniae]|uniref:Com family DNA-binding transcriptional regulator n=1 Tax=Conchiformibius kuhniae TaxID=211502 RepID=A0A8T9MTZ6_9NEIS|nr:Com family DNA-binding transcriptional regulator [Conchiformibius kuhniae]
MAYRILRCQSCNKRLGDADGAYSLSIKCSRCRALNYFKSF